MSEQIENGLCKHGNYHCQICEVVLLKLVIADLQKEVESLKAITELKNTEIDKLNEIIRTLGLTLANVSGIERLSHEIN